MDKKDLSLKINKLFRDGNLCNQGLGERGNVDNLIPPKPCTEDQIDIIKKTGKLKGYIIFGEKDKDNLMCSKSVYPELIKCKVGEEPGENNENCCPALEYDIYLVQLILRKKSIFIEEFIEQFDKVDPAKKEIFIQKIIETEKQNLRNQKIKTETKQVVVPVDRPLTIEEMGLLEATIYGSFVIVKSLLK